MIGLTVKMFGQKYSLSRYSVITLFFFLLSSLASCQKSSDSEDESGPAKIGSADVRQSVIAGSWYPGDPGSLAAEVGRFLKNVEKVRIEGELLALICPHAGYRYSGQVAAYSYKLLAGKKTETVVLIGPSHRYPFKGFSVYDKGGYQTPLGLVPINVELASALIKSNELIKFIPQAHLAEHSIEIQLPFLQHMLTSFDFVPVVVGPYSSIEDCQIFSNALVELISSRENTIIVASSDMSHYPPYEEAVRVDREMLSAVESFDLMRVVDTDAKMLKQNIPNLSCTFCGFNPVVVTLMAAKRLGANEVKVLKYANSGDRPGGDKNRVVGYGAVAIYRKDEIGSKLEFEPLGQEAQQVVLRMAREAIETYLSTGGLPEYKPELPVLNEKRGVFVTITKHGRLRGCIGYHGNDVPLYKLVPDRAIAAAVKDSRFPPLSPNELDEIKIKVSVYLTNVYRIKGLDEFELGKQGIILRKGGRGATYLPEVPVEAGWTKEEEMEHLCRKAGLPPGAWKEGAELYVYSTQVFGEK
ncbi:MAG: AmmeMemoRadiSam system protein B [bacterium]